MEVRWNKTILSAGRLVMQLLNGIEGVSVYSVISPSESTMPAVIYRRAGLQEQPVKGSLPADAAFYEFEVWTTDYEEGLAIAEQIRARIEGSQGFIDRETGLKLRAAMLTDGYEQGTIEGAYIQSLTFLLRINRIY